MANKVSINVELKTKIQDQVKHLQSQAAGLKLTPKDTAYIQEAMQDINRFLSKENWQIKDINEAISALNKLNGHINKLHLESASASEEVKKYNEQLEKLEKAKQEARKNLTTKEDQAGKFQSKDGLYSDVALRKMDVKKIFEDYQSLAADEYKIRGVRGDKPIGFETFWKHYKEDPSKIKNLERAEPGKTSLLTQIKEAETDLTTELNKLAQAVAQAHIDLETHKKNVPKEVTENPIVSDNLAKNDELKKGLEGLADEMREAKDDGDSLSASSIELNTNLDKQTSSLGKAFKQFTIYHLALKFTKKALREAVSTVKELDKELTEQAMVTGMTRKETYGLMKTYQELALATGATTKEVASVATEYIKQGKSIQEATLLTQAAVSAAKVAGVSTADSVNYLTTALNGFQLAASDAMLVSDKFAAVAAASATDYDELAIALSKVASQANLAGMSIDYTTALLTKGLETTREAPETMGTALKTIIARMRELGDYGETLEGDTDINNVEKQLAYVGIALRDQQGELRSTEEVLDELGKKWDTLNKNQQAAVAKALAGTRQQSRLIAMMSDYERVTELQQISQRSAGATAAQAGVYLEGMEASLNKITVAWEKIVTSLTNSEFIINIFGGLGNILDVVGEALDSISGQVVVYTTLANLGLTMLGTKIQENRLAKIQNQLALEKNIKDNQAWINAKKIWALEKNITKEDERQARLTDLKERAKKGEDVSAELDLMLKENEAAQTALDNDLSYQYALGVQNNLLTQKNSLTQKYYALQGLIQGGQATITAGYTAWVFLKTLLLKKDKQRYAQELKNQALEKKGFAQSLKNAGAKMAESVAANPGWGWATAIAILAAVGIGLGAIIIKNTGVEKGAEKAANSINKLSNEIYKLSEKANAVKQITSAYDELDNKIIKTKKDQEELNSLLGQAADKLSTETYSSKKKADKAGAAYYGEGVSEQDYYNSLSTDREKKKFLDSLEAETDRQIKIRQQEQINEVKKLSNKRKAAFFNENTTNSLIKQAQSAFYAIANSNLYDRIDAMTDVTEEEAAAIESVTQAMIANLSVREAYDYANNPEKVQAIIDKLKDLEQIQIKVNDRMEDVSASEILNSDDFNLKDRVKAYEAAAKALEDTDEAYDAFKTEYKQYQLFAEMNDDVLDFIDSMGWSIDQINTMGEGWKKLQKAGIAMAEAEYKALFTSSDGILATLQQTGGNVAATIDAIFGDYIEGVEGYADKYNQILDIFAETMTVGMSNMGQNIEKVGNSINSVYEKASKWNELKESEKMSFMQDNADLFEGESGQEMLAAFESGNYRRIEEALRNNKGLQDQLDAQIKQIENELQIEMARVGEERNEAYIKYLQEWRDKLSSSTDIFQADLELLIEQEKKQLDTYREYLEKQQEELEESLEKRKEAYEEYFDAIGQEQENADYEEERNKLITNISKLAGSTDFSSQKQMKELEQQLADLEKERQKELRERAQEALIEALDKNVEEINEKFDKLLESEGSLLNAMKSDLQTNPNLLSDILYSAIGDGQMTALNATQYAKDLVSAFESAGADTSDIKEFMESIQNNATFNLANGQTVNIDGEDANMLWAAIQSILTKKGYGN